MFSFLAAQQGLVLASYNPNALVLELKIIIDSIIQ